MIAGGYINETADSYGIGTMNRERSLLYAFCKHFYRMTLYIDNIPMIVQSDRVELRTEQHGLGYVVIEVLDTQSGRLLTGIGLDLIGIGSPSIGLLIELETLVYALDAIKKFAI